MNKNNKLFRKLFWIGASIFSLSIISFSLYKENNPNNQFNLFNNQTIINQENIVKEAKVETLFPITTIRKVTNDRDAINLIFTGDYFTDQKEFDDLVFNKRVDSWFNTGWTNPIFANSEYMSKINAYSIMTPTPEGATLRDGNGWLGLGLSGNKLFLSNFGFYKSNFLLDNFSNNFLDSGSYVASSTINIIGKGGNIASIAVTDLGNTNLTNSYNAPEVALHELCHSIFDLRDEYLVNSGRYGPNRQKIENPNPTADEIQWKEFLSFRGIHIVNSGDWIPSRNCLMGDYLSTGTMPCEVCIHQIAKTFNNLLQRNDLYIADPQLTTKHLAWNEEGYSNINWNSIEINNNNITNANNKELEFRTVIDNWTGYNKKIKLRIKITDSLDNQKYIKESEIHEIATNQIKGLALFTDVINGLVYGDKIIGEVIDADTEKVLSTNYKRKTQSRVVKIDYLLNDGKDTPLPNVYSTNTRYLDGTTVQLDKVLFNGYKFISSSDPDMKLEVNGSDQNVKFYYEKLPHKTIKLKLWDENKILKKEKLLDIYEGQIFVPNSSNFPAYEVETMDRNSYWNNIVEVVEPNKIYDYNNVDSNTEVNYIWKVGNNWNHHIYAQDRKIFQGTYSDYIDENFIQVYRNDYITENRSYFPQNTKIIYNDVDLNTEGIYKIVFLYEYNLKGTIYPSQYEINVNILKNQNPSWNPDYLEGEIHRINSLTFLPNNDVYTTENYNSLNSQNFINEIKNGSFNKGKYNYELVEFSKVNSILKMKQNISFKVKVTYNGVSKTSDLKTVSVNVDNSIVNSDLQKLEQEVNRINLLNLTLNKNEYTQEEINQITSSNILQNLNNWTTTTGFLYEIINFNKTSETILFSISIKLQSNQTLSRNSKQFVLNFKNISNPNPPIPVDPTPEEEIQQEINTVNNNISQLKLIKTEFTNEEINNINENNFIQHLSNWNVININENKYSYEIVNFKIIDNSFEFQIKINSKSNSSLSSISKTQKIPFLIANNPVDPTPENQNNNLTIVLLSVFIPLFVIILGIVFSIIFIRKKKRKY